MDMNTREKWIYILTVMKSVETVKALPMEMQQEICEFLRSKLCPEIEYPEWLKMEKDMIKFKRQMMDLMVEGMNASTGKPLPPEAKKMFDEADIAKLDDTSRKSIQKIDFEKLKKVFDNLPEQAQKELRPMFNEVHGLAKQYKKEKGEQNDENKV